MKYKLCLIMTMIGLLAGCQQGTSNSASTSATTTGTAPATVMPPQYLAIKGFQTCLSSKTQGSAQFWCLPKTQPTKCSNSTWKQLIGLKGEDTIPPC